jgi:hypothetical protein
MTSNSNCICHFRYLTNCKLSVSSTERRGRVANTPFQVQISAPILAILTCFVVFVSHARKVLVLYLKIRPRPLLSHPFQFIIHLFPFHSTICSESQKKCRSINHKQSMDSKLMLKKMANCIIDRSAAQGDLA